MIVINHLENIALQTLFPIQLSIFHFKIKQAWWGEKKTTNITQSPNLMTVSSSETGQYTHRQQTGIWPSPGPAPQPHTSAGLAQNHHAALIGDPWWVNSTT